MEQKKDVVIVGGGVIGLCTAYYLHLAGAAVTVIERNQVGAGCSLGNAGWVTPSHLVPLAAPGVISKGLKWMLNPESPFYIKPRMDRRLLSWLWEFRKASTQEHVEQCAPILGALGVASRDLYRHFSEDLGLSFQHEELGLLYVPRTDKGYHECLEEAEWIERDGQEVRRLSPSEMHELEPSVRDDLKGGIFCPGDAHIHPFKFSTELANWLRLEGVSIVENTAVTGWNSNGKTVASVTTKSGEFAATEFVLAGGAWSPAIVHALGLRLPVQPAKGYSLTVPQTGTHTRRSVYLYEAKIAVTPLSEQIRYAGTLELAGINLSVNQRRVEAIRKAVPHYMNNFNATASGSAAPWAGLRPCSPDGMPYIGRTGVRNNVSVATGHAMVGVSLAPVTGKLVAQMVGGEQPDIPLDLMRPDRFDR